ncbi:circadian associated repressor of transcription a [Trichomycterus rosablanca]|uniref:circadian associated repressor of transcription a n=1 Tax=Trichomycterus rosablanca TaxID=2290929 RepID=UPI002F3524A9
MQSVESTSLQASSDWPSSGEDDSEVFLSEEERSEITRGHSRLSSSSLSSSSSSELGWCSTEGEKEKAGGTRGDLLFAQKCLELQGFVRPLLELLNGLKKGRFDKGLSSFQQSVAMDRIQRIMGLLQKPHIGERYLPTLLQVEIMVKHWFPQVCLQSAGTSGSTHHLGQNSPSSSTPIHKHKDQLHIPVKKRKLSWSNTPTDSSTSPSPVARKCYHVNEKEKETQSLSLGTAPAPQTDQPEPKNREPSGSKALCCSEPSLTWVHISPQLSPPKSCPSSKILGNGSKHDRKAHFLLTLPSTSNRGSPATQDSAVSSTTSFSEPVARQSQQEMTDQAEERGQSS